MVAFFTPFGERRRLRARAPPKKARRRTTEPGLVPRKREMTASQIAKANLSKALSTYITDGDARRRLVNDVGDLEQLRYMHMPTLAAALTYLYRLGETEVSPEVYTDAQLLPLITPLLPEKTLSPEEKALLILRHKATLLRYVRTILFYRQAQKERIEEIRGATELIEPMVPEA